MTSTGLNMCMNVLKKANQSLGILKRSLGYKNMPGTKLLAYKALVRQLLDYASIVWSQLMIKSNYKQLKEFRNVQ